MDKMTNVLMFNMCMVVDKERNKVLVLDKIDSQWGGITFPGGHIENGESITESTIREIKEETGLDISGLESCGIIDWYNSDTHDRWLIFLYRTECFSGQLVSETEEGKVFWIDMTDIYNQKLASGMETYLKLFFGDKYNEAYAIWSDKSVGEFQLL